MARAPVSEGSFAANSRLRRFYALGGEGAHRGTVDVVLGASGQGVGDNVAAEATAEELSAAEGVVQTVLLSSVRGDLRALVRTGDRLTSGGGMLTSENLRFRAAVVPGAVVVWEVFSPETNIDGGEATRSPRYQFRNART